MSRTLVRNTVLFSMSALAMVSCADIVPINSPGDQPVIATSNPVAIQPEPVQPPPPPPPPIVSNKYVSLGNLNLNNQGNQITIKPGRTIEAALDYSYHCPNCKSGRGNQIIVGLAKRSAQACIYDGGTEGQGSANFVLKVPAKPGRYDVRFRGLQAADCTAALQAGWGADDSPAKETTIGTITVSRKAEV